MKDATKQKANNTESNKRGVISLPTTLHRTFAVACSLIGIPQKQGAIEAVESWLSSKKSVIKEASKEFNK